MTGDMSNEETTPTLWFLDGEQFGLVEHSDAGAGAPLAETLAALLRGPGDREGLNTAIPDGTTLGDVAVSGDGRARIELSPEFLADVPAETAERTTDQRRLLDARVGQVALTATQFDEVDAVDVVVDGVAVASHVEQGEYDEDEHEDAPPGVAAAVGAPEARRPSNEIREVQARLARLRYLPQSGVDGIAGEQTRHAVMAFQQWTGIASDGVAGPITRRKLETAKPPNPGSSAGGRRMEVHRRRGVTLVIERGKLVRALHCSTGMPGFATPSGRFRVFRKELRSWSFPYRVWLPYASYIVGGVAFHEGQVPNYPASHGCVRLPAPEARGAYRFAKIGTTVLVF